MNPKKVRVHLMVFNDGTKDVKHLDTGLEVADVSQTKAEIINQILRPSESNVRDRILSVYFTEIEDNSPKIEV